MKGIKKIISKYQVWVNDKEGKVIDRFEQSEVPNETKILTKTIKMLETRYRRELAIAKDRGTEKPKKPSYMLEVSYRKVDQIRWLSWEDFMLYSNIVGDE